MIASLYVMRSALQGVRARPWRSALTGVSIVVATVSILVATVGSQLFGDYQRDSFNLNGGLVATVEVAIDSDQLLEQSPAGAIAHVQHLAPPGAAVDIVYESGGVTIESGRTPVAAGMSLVAGSGVVARDVTSGRWLRPADANDAVPALVLNRAADDALGHPLFIRCWFGESTPEQVFRVVGVIDDAASPDAFADLADPRLRIPEVLGRRVDNSAALRVHGDEDDLAGITRAARDGSTLTGLTGRYSPSVARSDGGAAVVDLVDKVKTGTEAISVLMLAIAVLGILNIGFASVRERSEELTLRRALGATKAGIAALMLLESAIIGVTAVAVALAMSYLLYSVFVAGLIVQLPANVPAYPVTAAMVGTAVSLTAAMLAAGLPAIRATRVEPAAMMRA